MLTGTDKDQIDDYGPAEPAAWRSVDWSKHQRWLLIGGRRVNAIQAGSGPDLVLIHGIMGRWQHWLAVIPELMKNYRVLAFDLPGFGSSEMPNERISIDHYSEVTAEVLEQLGIKKAHVAASSMGGQIAVELAASRPDLVEKLVLSSPAGISTYNKSYRRYSPGVISGKAGQMLGGLPNMRFEMVVRRPAFVKLALGIAIRHPEKLPKDLAYELLEGAGKPGFESALDSLCNFDLRERLTRVACPSLVVWGENDRIIPARDLNVFAELIPDVKTVIYPDTGHGPMIERPSRFVKDVHDFLSR